MSLLLLFNSVEVINRDANLTAEFRGCDQPLLLEDGQELLLESGAALLVEGEECTVERDAQSPMVWGGTATRDGQVPLELLAVLQRVPLVPVDVLAGLLRDARLPAEVLAQLLRDARLPAETLAGLSRDASLPVELAGILQRDAQLPVEYQVQTLEQLFRDSNLPVEWLATPSPFVPGNWIAVVGAVAWRSSWREIPTPTGYEYRPAERGREPVRRRRRRRRPAPVAESQVLVSSVSEEALCRGRAMIRLYQRHLAQIEAREAQQRADEDVLLALM